MNSDTANSFAENFLGTLISPRSTFKQIASRAESGWTGIEAALIVVVLVSLVDGLVSCGQQFQWWVPFLSLLAVVGGLVSWLVLAGTAALAAVVFNTEPARIRASFICSAWAFLPWLFMAPATAYHSAFGPIMLPLALLPCVWVLYLQWLAFQETYQLKGWQTLFLLVFLPQLGLSLCIWWSLQILGTGLSLLVR
jgi:hypothetical protein